MRVLISAYACGPGEGSEPGAGWAWTRAAALGHQVWVLTRENNSTSIQSALKQEPDLMLYPVYLDLPKWARWWKRGTRGARTYYVLWQWYARRTAKRLHQKHHFAVAHHLTFAMDSMPAAVVGIAGLPSVWGPVGGTSPFPWRMRRWLGVRGVLTEINRSIVGGIGRAVFGRSVAKKASLVVAQNHDVATRFASQNPIVEPNVAIDIQGLPHRSQLDVGALKTAVFAGHLQTFKGILLALDALADPAASGWRLLVFGDGPARTVAERRVEELALGDRIQFRGAVPREQFLESLVNADMLLFPSMHDSAPWVVGEAIAARVPVTALDVGGPRTLIDSTGGGLTVPLLPDAPARLAAALHRPATAVSVAAVDARRLPATISSWYSTAVRSVSGDP